LDQNISGSVQVTYLKAATLSETADVPPIRFCGLRLKMYSLATLSGEREYRKANFPEPEIVWSKTGV